MNKEKGVSLKEARLWWRRRSCGKDHQSVLSGVREGSESEARGEGSVSIIYFLQMSLLK